MICAECKKKFHNPLIRFTGDRVCPACLKSLFPVVKIPEITEENHRLFTRSEDLYYNGYLLNTSAGGRNATERERHLEEAINLCREAARLKNPYAMLKLGAYYTENYIKDATSDSFNRVAASNLYEQLASAGEIYLRDYIVDGVVEQNYAMSAAEVLALREEAERRLTQLKQAQNEADGMSGVEAFISTLRAMRASNGRTPVFAIFKLDRVKLFEALADEVTTDVDKIADARHLLCGNAANNAEETLKHKTISEISKLFGRVQIFVRTNAKFQFVPIGDRSGGNHFKWEPFFRGTSQWATTEYGRDYGYFYLFHAAAKTKLIDIKKLGGHLRKFAPLYTSEEMMKIRDHSIFFTDDFYYHFSKSGKSYGRDTLSADLIKDYIEFSVNSR